MPTKANKSHHHGNLKTVLVDAGLQLLAEGGLAALTLRKCAARAGVSHAAPAHHFDGLKGLRTAIATAGFKAFAKAMIEQRDSAADSPHARLAAIGRGYLSFSENNEALATLMFMTKETFTDDPDYQLAGEAAYQVLADACTPFKSGAAGAKGTEVLVWSLVQGYASLARSGQIDPHETPYAEILPLLALQLR
ncbi:MAG: TetR/AcrR family transcriptional regulator [Gammaproteobacteria bacterium]|nr:TetR/AcrR family transcriptional regulator [Gammaproteobacteria bacterium]